MALPKKISPVNIREAVVEVRYTADLPFEVLVGLFFHAFDESYSYANRPVQQPVMNTLPGSPGQEITIKVGVPSYLYNDEISLQLQPMAFVFTYLNLYEGWDDYRSEIEKALQILMNSGHVKTITRVGIRYISEYPNKDLRECINFEYKFGLPAVVSETVSFRSEFMHNGMKVILNLNNHVPFLKPDPTTKQMVIVNTSIIDIDVIREGLTISNLNELIAVIDESHRTEKELFFGMLRNDYLETLNPEY